MFILFIVCCILDSVRRVGGNALKVSWVSSDDKVISVSLYFSSSIGNKIIFRYYFSGCYVIGCYIFRGCIRGCGCICSCIYSFGCWCFLLRLFIIDNNLGCFRKVEVFFIVVDIFYFIFVSVWDNVIFINICG